MVKNFSGGSKHKKFKRGNNSRQTKNIDKHPGCEYAFVKKALGDCRFELICYDKKERQGRVCGKMRKKVFVKINDIVLIGLREFEDNKCDIQQKYTNDQVKTLIKQNMLTENFVNQGNSDYVDNDDEDDIFDRTGTVNSNYYNFEEMSDEDSDEESIEETDKSSEESNKDTDTTENNSDSESDTEDISEKFKYKQKEKYKKLKQDMIKYEDEEIDIDDI